MHTYRSVIAQDHDLVLGTEVAPYALLHGLVDEYAGKVVIAHVAAHERVLCDGQEAARERRDGARQRRVHMQHGVDVRPSVVNGRVEDEAGLVDAVRGGAGVDHVACRVDLDQARGAHLAIRQTERVDQKVLAILGRPDLISRHKQVFYASATRRERQRER